MDYPRNKHGIRILDNPKHANGIIKDISCDVIGHDGPRSGKDRSVADDAFGGHYEHERKCTRCGQTFWQIGV